MSDLLIRGMEMPADDMKNIMIFSDGRVFQFSGYGNPKPLGTAVPVPAHGRLIDADALKKIVGDAKHMDAVIFDGKTMYSDHLCVGADYDDVCAAIDETPTIIPAEPCNNLSKPCKKEGK